LRVMKIAMYLVV